MLFGNNETITHVHTNKLYGKFTCMIAAFNGLRFLIIHGMIQSVNLIFNLTS